MKKRNACLLVLFVSQAMAGKGLPISGKYRELFSDSVPFSIELTIADSSYRSQIIQKFKGLPDTSTDSNVVKWLGNENYGISWLGGRGTSKTTGRPLVMYQKMRLSGDTLKMGTYNIFTGKNKTIYGEWKSKFIYSKPGATAWDSTILIFSPDKMKTIFASRRDTSVYLLKLSGDTVCASVPTAMAAEADAPRRWIRWTYSISNDTLYWIPSTKPVLFKRVGVK
jgi:hypothetical protein